MTHEMQVPFKALVICEETKHLCEACGDKEELRPYGPDGANICFACMMNDETLAQDIFKRRIGDACTH